MKITDRTIVYKGFNQIVKLTLTNNGQTLEREQYKTKNAVAALVYDTLKKVYVLVKQFRIGAEQDLVEVVAGYIDKTDPDNETAIKREVEEETGYAVDSVTHIADFYTSPGSSTEIIYLYYIEVSRKTNEGGGLDEEHENITLVELTAEQLLQQNLPDSKTLVAVMWLHSNRKLTSSSVDN